MPRHSSPAASRPAALLVEATHRLEQSASLDGLVSAYARIADPLDRWRRSDLLRAGLIGHALHPILTDLPIGCWTAATALDLRGRPEDRGASRWLVGAGLAAVAPTVATGLAEWARAGREAQRVGALHGALNVVATTLYATSYAARSRRHHGLGVAAALAGAAVTGASGYLGGHLTTARKVGSRDPSFADDNTWSSPGSDPGPDPTTGRGSLT